VFFFSIQLSYETTRQIIQISGETNEQIYRQTGGANINFSIPIIPGIVHSKKLQVMFNNPSDISMLHRIHKKNNKNNIVEVYQQQFNNIVKRAQLQNEGKEFEYHKVENLFKKKLNTLTKYIKDVDDLFMETEKIEFLRNTYDVLNERMKDVGEKQVLKESEYIIKDVYNGLHDVDINDKYISKYNKYVAKIGKHEDDVVKILVKFDNHFKKLI
jgi:hypothetical protein